MKKDKLDDGPERVEEQPPMKDVNLGSKDGERVEKDLESCPHSEDGVNLGLNLSDDDDEINENMTLNSEFDKDLLNQGNIANEEDNDHYVLMQASKLEKLIGDSVNCISCGGSDFKIEKVKGQYNLSTPFYALKCCREDCGMEASRRACPTKNIRGKEVSDIIARFSMINADMGVGYNALASVFTAFNLPVPSLTQTGKVGRLLLLEIEEQGKLILERCRAVVHKYYEKYFPNSVNESGRAMIVVCFDGSWKTRGHHSHIGIGFVVDSETNLIVDFHILCNFCQMCALYKKKLNGSKFDEWVKQHKEKNECDQNFSAELSSGSMEPEIARILWERSKNSNLWYTTMVTDGDSKAHTKVKEISPYGDIIVKKEECHNHINKRMKRVLNQVVKDEGLRENTEKEYFLTEAKINAFSNFYNKAITENVGNIKKMKNAIMASFYHHVQTPKEPIGDHHLCPEGKDSWCFYKKAQHEGKEPDPKNFTHPISKKVLNCILNAKIFKDLTSDALLLRCTGKTQNLNESLHSRVWKIVPKDQYKGVMYVKIAMWLVMTKHNLGIVEQGELCEDFATPEKMEKRRENYSPEKSKKVKETRIKSSEKEARKDGLCARRRRLKLSCSNFHIKLNFRVQPQKDSENSAGKC
ncbi:Dehydrogenase/reductase SDR family member 11 [Armadillidium vulgare]|nr:Dehydrogenase/reductase SDR family member 11 [Armadillidium vulgare]